MKDICNFIPSKGGHSNIECYHFVYETEIRKFTMPIVRNNYYVNIVFKGEGILKSEEKEYQLTPGTLFFSFPGVPFSIECNNEFTFLYISFNGEGAKALLESYNIKKENFIFYNLENLSEFWMKEVRRISSANAVLLTESILMYSLSFAVDNDNDRENDKTRFERLIEYIKLNFRNTDLSLTKVSDIFFYNKKYLSSLFIKETGIKFTDYLSQLRINEAKKLIEDGEKSVTEISSRCGFSDPYYFSKVFRKYEGNSPTAFMNNETSISVKEG